MNRRGFLSALIGAGVAAAADPERLLWTPGQKLISIPRPKNPLLTPEFYAREALEVMQRNLLFARTLSQYEPTPILRRSGGTIIIRRPARFSIHES